MRNFPLKYSHVTTFYRNFVAKTGRQEIILQSWFDRITPIRKF